jgi:hypothetical protein
VKQYKVSGMRAVRAESFSDAAHVFALRLARRIYGRRGEYHSLNQSGWTNDAQGHTKSAHYEPFIGVQTGGRAAYRMCGRNVFFTVTIVEAESL